MFVYRVEKLKEANYIRMTNYKHKRIYKRNMKELAESIDGVELFDVNEKKELMLIKDKGAIEEKIEMYKQQYSISRAEFINSMINLAEEYYGYRFLALDRNYITRENIGLIYKQIEECKKSNKKLRVGIDGRMDKKDNTGCVDYIYTDEELRLLAKLNEKLVENGCPELIFFELYHLEDSEDFDNGWKFKDVVHANNIIKQYAQYILERKFTPFEAVLYVHQEATRLIYNKGENYESGRVLPSIVSEKNVVCAGYASFVKAIIDELNFDGLKCEIKGCAFLQENGIMEKGHCHNLIHIKDKVYRIDGTYIEDAGFDSKIKGDDINGVGCCLYPIEDIACFENAYYEVEGKDRLANLILDLENAKYYAWAVEDNVFKKAIAKLVVGIKQRMIPSFVEKYQDKSNPILVEKYQEALRVIFSKEYKGNALNEVVDEKIIASIDKVLSTFGEESVSDFACQYKELKERIRR